jgi:hypothetical protein
MERFDYEGYTNKRQEILSNFDAFCDELENRALNSFGKVDDDERGITDDFITDAASYRKNGGRNRIIEEAAVDVPPAIFDAISDDL